MVRVPWTTVSRRLCRHQDQCREPDDRDDGGRNGAHCFSFAVGYSNLHAISRGLVLHMLLGNFTTGEIRG